MNILLRQVTDISGNVAKRCCVDLSAITNMSEVFCETEKSARTRFAPIMPSQKSVGPKFK